MARNAVGWVIFTLVVGSILVSISISAIWWLPRISKSPTGDLLPNGKACNNDNECQTNKCLLLCCNKFMKEQNCKTCDSFGRCIECISDDYNVTYNGQCIPKVCDSSYLCT